MITAGRIYILPVLCFEIDVYFSFLLFHYQSITITYTSFHSIHVLDKFIKFNELNKILKRENLSLILRKTWCEERPQRQQCPSNRAKNTLGI